MLCTRVQCNIIIEDIFTNYRSEAQMERVTVVKMYRRLLNIKDLQRVQLQLLKASSQSRTTGNCLRSKKLQGCFPQQPKVRLKASHKGRVALRRAFDST